MLHNAVHDLITKMYYKNYNNATVTASCVEYKVWLSVLFEGPLSTYIYLKWKGVLLYLHVYLLYLCSDVDSDNFVFC
jgi:hypothetical protein